VNSDSLTVFTTYLLSRIKIWKCNTFSEGRGHFFF